VVERARPDRWDLIGAAVCLGGAAFILLGPRGSWLPPCGEARGKWQRDALAEGRWRSVAAPPPTHRRW